MTWASKSEKIRALMAAREWDAAVLAAAKLPVLDIHRAAILSGREAILRPDFQRQIRRDPEILKQAAIAALKERFGNV